MEILEFKPCREKITEEERRVLLEQGCSYCPVCGQVKKLEEFYKNRANKFGYSNQCAKCLRERSKAYRERYPFQARLSRRRTRDKRRDYYVEQSAEWKRNNRDKVNQYKQIRYKEDPLYRLQHISRTMVQRACILIGTDKEENTRYFLGYAPKDLKERLESQFVEGMSWDNHGEWHIDHIKPISLATNLEEAKELSQLENLQPLWAEDNLRKHNNF